MGVANFLRIAAFLTSLSISGLLLLSCSGMKTYPNSPEKNVTITTTTDSGSLFSSVNTRLDIYQVTPDCKLDYKGTVQLDTASVSIGIPSEKMSYLVFGFASSSFLASTSGSISYETIFKPRKGYHYTINASYIDNIYDVTIRESHPGKNLSRNIETVGLSNC